MKQDSLIHGKGLCKNCNSAIQWSVDLNDSKVKIKNGFINTYETGNEVEINVECNSCNASNLVYHKHLIKRT